ncbi:LacI family DNA-binding transcriptional regulator [Nocardioides euryhalodurans]|uniref:LacI family DNA-binding transcriptional regulator n=1 Tax=Nocardioides euryhalodurans TaxID=2518370 RepID=A0A4P7GL80_9ACTN|nr:LacI family DNA-binding transcriptional regulator [Nocardioides euryhalodurans]QBR92683.1 LacI family DNA-binding transcriptional regulator [Nocardioides euryhalodurans]
MATLADIAAQASVSEATVSRVLNDKPGVSDGARAAVLTALDVLGYERPSRLRRRSAGLVGLVVPELENPIFPAFAQVIEDALAARRFTPVLCTQSPGGISEDEYVESLLDHGVAGILFVSGRHADTRADHERYQGLISRGMPVVFVNGYAEGIAAPFFSCDDVEAMKVAVGHLVQLGHERIGLAIGPRRYVPALRKRDGFVRALVDTLGLSPAAAEGWIAEGLFTAEGGAAAARQLLAKGATAIVNGSDLMALGAIQAARESGLDVPRDVSVVGFDDSRLIQYLDPPLTTVRQPVQALGAAAVSALADAIDGLPVPSQEYLYKPELVLRASTGRAPAQAQPMRVPSSAPTA